MINSLSRLTKNRNFLFCVITYPLTFCIYLYLLKYLQNNPWSLYKVKWYSGISIMVFTTLTLFTLYELIEKRLFHKRQGDKLKIRQHQGDWRKADGSDNNVGKG